MMMKKVALLMVLVLVAALAVAPVLAGEGAKKKNTHEVTAEFVSADMTAKTMTFKNEKGEVTTAPVMESAMKDLTSLKGGEKITCTCLDDETGKHQGVSAIKVAMAQKY